MGDILVKSRADTEAEKRAEAEASFKEKKDRRDLPKPKAFKDMTDEEKEDIKIERPEGGEVGVGKVTRDSAETAFEDLGITRTTPTKIREDDDEETFTSTTGYEERDRKRLEEALENAKEAGDEGKIKTLKEAIKNIQPDFVPDPSKRRKVAVEGKPKLSRREIGSGDSREAKIAQLKDKLEDARSTQVGEQMDLDRVRDLQTRIDLLENDPTFFSEEATLQQSAEMQGLDFEQLQSKALNEIKRVARERNIPIDKNNPEYKELLNGYKPMIEEMIIGKQPTAMMRTDDEFDTLEEAVAAGKAKEVAVRPSLASQKEEEEESNKDAIDRKTALVAIHRLQQEQGKARDAGDSDKVAVLQSQIEEEASVFPPEGREYVANNPVDLKRLAGMMGAGAIESEETESIKRRNQIDKIESQLFEPYIMAGDGDGNINPTHSLYIKTRIEAQDKLQALQGTEAETDFNRLRGRLQRLERHQQVTGVEDEAAKNKLIEDLQNNDYFQATNALVNLNRRLKAKGPVQDVQSNPEQRQQIEQLEQRLQDFRNSDSAMEEKQRFAEEARREIEEQGLSIRDSEGKLTPEYTQLLNSKLENTEVAQLERELNDLKSSQQLPSTRSRTMQSVPAGLGGTISQTPQGLDISTDIAEPIPAREFFLQQLKGRPTAGSRSVGGRGIGRDISGMSMRDAQMILDGIGPTLRHNVDETNAKRKESGLPPLPFKDEQQMLVHWDFKHDPIFVEQAQALGLEVPSYREAFQQGRMLAENQAGRSADARKFRGRTDTTDRRQLDTLMKESISRFLAQHITTPENAKEILGKHYATILPSEHPELIPNIDTEKLTKKLEKLKTLQELADDRAAMRDPEKVKAYQEMQQRIQNEKEEGMTKRAIQRAAEVHNFERRGHSDRVKGIGFNGKTANQMDEASVLLTEAAQVKQDAEKASFLGNEAPFEKRLLAIQTQLTNKYGYPANYIYDKDISTINQHVNQLQGSVTELRSTTKEMLDAYSIHFRDIMNQMKSNNELAGGDKPYRVGTQIPLPDIDMDPDKPKEERGRYDIEGMQLQAKVARERGDSDLARQLELQIQVARDAMKNKKTLTQLHDDLRVAENRAEEKGIEPDRDPNVIRIINAIKNRGEEKVTFTGMGDNEVRRRVDFSEQPLPTRMGQQDLGKMTHGELLYAVGEEMSNRSQEVDRAIREIGTQRELGMDAIEFQDLSPAARLAAEQRSREGLKQIGEASTEPLRRDDEGFLSVPSNAESQIAGRDKRLEQYGPKRSRDKSKGFEGDKLSTRTGAETDSKARLLGISDDVQEDYALAEMFGPEKIQELLSDPRVQAVTSTGAYVSASPRKKVEMMLAASKGNLTAEDLQPAAPPAPPAPASAAPADSGFAGEPPSPLPASLQEAEPANIFQQQPPPPTPEPMDSTTEQQPEVAGVAPQPMDFGQQQSVASPMAGTKVTETPNLQPTQEELAQMIQQMGATNPQFLQSLAGKSVEEVEAALLEQMKRKSEPMQRFDTTVGDDLLKSIKDRFWRQGY